MFNTLPASNASPARSAGGVVFSVALHTAIVGAAVWLTAGRAGALLDPPRDARIHYQTQLAAARPPRGPLPPADPQMPTIDVSTAICDLSPPIDLSYDANPREAATLGPTTALPRIGSLNAAPHDLQAPYDAEYVEKPVELLAGQPVPRYPELLRTAGVDGHVLMRFVVDTLGRVERNSLEVVEASHALFGDAVRAVLLRQRFLPAEVGGRRVRQLVVQPFEFRIRS